MIVEGLLTTTDTAGKVNVAPMGPIIHGNFETMTLRPFQGSTTYENLLATRVGVFHVVDQVGLLAEAAIRRLSAEGLPPMEPAVAVSGVVLADCCRWFELKIIDVDVSDQRSRMTAHVVHCQERRPHVGFNRARHAVIEAAILATRVHLLTQEEIESALHFLKPAVEKTGDQPERDAFQMLQTYIETHYAEAPVNE